MMIMNTGSSKDTDEVFTGNSLIQLIVMAIYGLIGRHCQAFYSGKSLMSGFFIISSGL